MEKMGEKEERTEILLKGCVVCIHKTSEMLLSVLKSHVNLDCEACSNGLGFSMMLRTVETFCHL